MGDTPQKVSPVKVDSQLNSIDLMYFGRNIGKAFGKPRLQTDTFIKNAFAHTLSDSEISTIGRKMPIQTLHIQLNWMGRLFNSNIAKHYPLHPNSPYPFS